MTERNQQHVSGAHEVVTADNTGEQTPVEKDKGHEEHSFGLHWGEQREREHRSKVTSTIVLAVLFVALLGTYLYLHGSTRFELFQPTPTSSTVQTIPIIPWEEYQKQMQQEQPSSQTTPPTSSESSSSPSDELTTEPAPGEEPGSDSETTRRPLLPPFNDSGSTQPSDSHPAPESAPAQ